MRGLPGLCHGEAVAASGSSTSRTTDPLGFVKDQLATVPSRGAASSAPKATERASAAARAPIRAVTEQESG